MYEGFPCNSKASTELFWNAISLSVTDLTTWEIQVAHSTCTLCRSHLATLQLINGSRTKPYLLYPSLSIHILSSYVTERISDQKIAMWWQNLTEITLCAWSFIFHQDILLVFSTTVFSCSTLSKLGMLKQCTGKRLRPVHMKKTSWNLF